MINAIYRVHCDRCGFEQDFEIDNSKLWNELKECEWHLEKDDGEWKHYCPECAEEFL